jgi:hypothetical protein
MYYPGICVKGLRKTMKNLRVARVQAQIWAQNLQGTHRNAEVNIQAFETAALYADVAARSGLITFRERDVGTLTGLWVAPETCLNTTTDFNFNKSRNWSNQTHLGIHYQMCHWLGLLRHHSSALQTFRLAEKRSVEH